ncbi:MAG TPA: hypothetical protein VLM42_00760 [Bryobacteraceae bacterium]|nr:hypothetical protein [Bryobacteraceae bacterium]
METRTQDPAGYYVWEVPGQPVIVHIRLDVVDRLAAEVMRGFGAVPKRGAEVGGVLIGTTRPGVPAIVRIDDFEAVPCEYRRGPSYLFTEEDGRDFEDCWNRLQPGSSPSAYAVGYFRSHTRDGFSLEAEDLELLDQFFPQPTTVALLIKPYATRVSAGAFFVREHGDFPEKSPLEFPLRRRELLGEEDPARRPLGEGRRVERRPRAAEENPQTAFGFSEPAREAPPIAEPVRAWRSGWVWLPLTFLFLLLGVALGYQLAQTMGARAAAAAAQDLSLTLSVKRNDNNLSVTWNRFAPSVRAAEKGLLEIDDGGYTKPVSLDAAQLQNGSLIYHNATNAVRFRLTVYPQARVSVVETFEWKQ